MALTRTPTTWVDRLSGLTLRDFAATLREDRDMLVQLAKLVSVANSCSDASIEEWACDLCTPANKPDETLVAHGTEMDRTDAGQMRGFRYGDVWLLVPRGTTTLSNINDDLNVNPSAAPTDWWTPSCYAGVSVAERELGGEESLPRVQTGFLVYWYSLSFPPGRTPLPKSPIDKSTKLLMAGHSLGGAVATVGALDLVSRGYNVIGLLSIEAPKAFNSAMGECFAGTPLGRTGTLRVTNAGDPVPHLGVGLVQAGGELHVPAWEFCTAEAVRRCNRGDGPCACASGDFAPVDFSRHCDFQDSLGLDFCSCSEDGKRVRTLRLLRDALVVGAAVLLFLAVRKTWRIISSDARRPDPGRSYPSSGP